MYKLIVFSIFVIWNKTNTYVTFEILLISLETDLSNLISLGCKKQSLLEIAF